MNTTGSAQEFPTPTADEKTMAMLSHLLMIFAGFVPPLVIYLVKRESKFVAFHAMQGLLWQVATVVVYFFGFATFFVSMLATMPYAGQKPEGSNPFPFAFFGFFAFVWIMVFGLWIANLTLGVVFCIRANHGEWASYPLFGRWARRIVGV